MIIEQGLDRIIKARCDAIKQDKKQKMDLRAWQTKQMKATA